MFALLVQQQNVTMQGAYMLGNFEKTYEGLLELWNGLLR